MDRKTIHIDTLYLSYNCDYSAYLEAMDIISQKDLLFYREGRHFYDFGFARVGWLDWEICQASNNYPFRIEYEFDYLYQTDLVNDWKQISLPFKDVEADFCDSVFDNYLISRLDYNITFQKEDTDILNKIFVSPYFQKPHLSLDSDYSTETVNLGFRRTGKTFRLYNKTKELSDKKDFLKCDMLRDKFGSLDNLYSIEVEMLRKYIISRTKSKGRLSDMDMVIDLGKHLLGSIKYCDYTEKNLALMRSKNYNKINFDYIAYYVSDIEFLPVKRYLKSRDNLLKVFDNILAQYNSLDGEKISFDDLAQMVSLRDKDTYMNDEELYKMIFNNEQLSLMINQ